MSGAATRPTPRPTQEVMALSVIGKEEGIVHGTPKGYKQHRYRKVPATEACGCLKAIRDYNAERATDRAPRASVTAHQWNNSGFTGEPGLSRAARVVHPPGDCPEPGCGAKDAPAEPKAPLPRGWVRVQVGGSSEPTRVYCSGGCAAVGVALAELRMAPA
ncbi:hypothetical protein [Streptacidiphilus neutrinimicus]|uniref:hypothetical protein n=1 Tax=Streptacidiphilus neutrinimicus TaxID=105420 RepID=UPI001F4347C4|nr:hypothetical protein [Streptacidiphilus neutrinimicus]